ncbi:hypothetical protein NQ318_008624, partial [Aromia moschata]
VPASETYDPPGNTKYPFGDEQQNVNSLEQDINNVHCVDQKDLKELQGKCPLQEATAEELDPYVACPGFDTIPPPHEIIFSTNEQQAPEVQCKKCDLRLTPDRTAVVVQCSHCFDIPSPDRKANRTEKDILYKAYFIQISNYTSVDVTGTENF